MTRRQKSQSTLSLLIFGLTLTMIGLLVGGSGMIHLAFVCIVLGMFFLSAALHLWRQV